MKTVKPSVPKVVITTDKPKGPAPAPIVRTTEAIATKQDQIRLVQEKVNRTVANVIIILLSHSHTSIFIFLQ